MATKRRKKRKASATKRISAALTRYLRKMNPSKMKGVTHVRVKKLTGGGLTIIPVRTIGNPRRRRNISEGFYSGGVFHPIRASYDYNVMRSGDGTKLMRSLTGGGKGKRRKGRRPKR